MDKYDITKADIVLILILLIISFLPLLSYIDKSNGDSFTITLDNHKYGEYSLSNDTTFAIDGNIGEIDILVENGKVCIVETSCPKKICKKFGATSSVLKPIVCIPNKLIIEVNMNNPKEEKLDAILR